MVFFPLLNSASLLETTVPRELMMATVTLAASFVEFTVMKDFEELGLGYTLDTPETNPGNF